MTTTPYSWTTPTGENRNAASRRFDAGDLLRIAASVSTAGAGVIHLAVARHHWRSLLLASAFIAFGVSQLAVADAVRRATPWGERMLLGVNASIVAVWLSSRTVGLGLVPVVSDVEPIGWADSVATGLAAASMLAVACPPAVRRRWLPPRRAACAVFAVLVVVVSLTVSASFASHDHGGHPPITDESHDGDVLPPAPSDSHEH